MSKRFNFKLLGTILAALLILTTVAFAASNGSIRLRGATQYLKMGGSTSGLLTISPAAVSGTTTLTGPGASLTLPAADGVAGQVVQTSGAGVQSYVTREKVLYAGLAASANHLGSTTAATTVMPASAEGTAATDIGAANLAVGSKLHFKVAVNALADSPGDETLTVNVLFGSKTVATSGAIAIDDSDEHIQLEGDVIVWTSHASTGTGVAVYRGGSVAASVAQTYDDLLLTSWNNTGTNAFIIQLDWGGTTAAADIAYVSYAELTTNNVD